MDFKTTINLTQKDYIQFVFFHQRKRKIWEPVIVTVSSFILFVILSKGDIMLSCLAAMIVGLICLPIFTMCLFLQCKRLWKKSAPIMRDAIETIFSDVGVYQKSKLGTLDLTFDNIFKVSETKNAFYVYISSIQAAIIPKRCFDRTEDIQAIRALFLNNMDAKKLSLMKV